MPEILDWQRVARPRAALRFVATALRQGALVALPAESTYVLAASARNPARAARLRDLAGGAPFTVAVTGIGAVRDWLPELGSAGERLVRRFWPGPVTLASGEGAAAGLLARLHPGLRDALLFDGRVSLWQPAHPLVNDLTRHLTAPLLTAPVPGQGDACTARQVLDAAGQHLDLVVDGGTARFRGPNTQVSVLGNAWSVARQGVVPEEELRQHLGCLIVFVCTGNTCRSPMAEAICKKRLAEHVGCAVEELPARGFVVISAGMAASPGMPAADEAVEVARALGVDLTRHQSRPLTAELVEAADHLLVMTSGHAAALEQHLGRNAARLRLLSPEGEDVVDPIGQPREVYEACARQMDDYLRAVLPELIAT